MIAMMFDLGIVDVTEKPDSLWSIPDVRLQYGWEARWAVYGSGETHTAEICGFVNQENQFVSIFDEWPFGGPDNLNWLHSDPDAAKWAREFVRLHGGDEALMLCWFANAIMAGWDAARARFGKQLDG